MEKDILQRYIGKMVRIETDKQRHPHVPYIGKIAEYNKDFIVLNPFADEFGSTGLSPSVEDMQKRDAGSTDLEITLGRRVIASLKRVKIEE